MTTIYLVRHSEPMNKRINLINNDSLQIMNEKSPLSIIGEKKAEELSNTVELQNIDLVIASNYVRAISTAKYIADKNNKNVYINEMFNERKHGINSWDELPSDFESEQLANENFKIGNGESRNEVTNRILNALMQIVKENPGKRIAIISHATAMMFLFMKLGIYRDKKVYFNNQILIDENFNWNAPEVFKLEFDENNQIISIQNIR